MHRVQLQWEAARSIWRDSRMTALRAVGHQGRAVAHPQGQLRDQPGPITRPDRGASGEEAQRHGRSLYQEGWQSPLDGAKAIVLAVQLARRTLKAGVEGCLSQLSNASGPRGRACVLIAPNDAHGDWRTWPSGCVRPATCWARTCRTLSLHLASPRPLDCPRHPCRMEGAVI